VVRRLIAESPELDISLGHRSVGLREQLQVSNLENMVALAKHDILLVADSDMRVRANYLARLRRRSTIPKRVW